VLFSNPAHDVKRMRMTVRLSTLFQNFAHVFSGP